MGIADLKAQARAAIHAAFSYPARYYPPGVTDPLLATTCDVRVTEFESSTQGALEEGMAGRIALSEPRITFLTATDPARKGQVEIIADGRRYQIVNVEPRYGLTVTAIVERMTP